MPLSLQQRVLKRRGMVYVRTCMAPAPKPFQPSNTAAHTPVYGPHSHRPLRNRACVIPFYKIGRAPPKYMLVRHRPTQEWGLLSGTCSRCERPVMCAMRELREETRDALELNFNSCNLKTTAPIIWPEGGVRYHVFFVDISNYRSPRALREAFHASKRNDKGYDETDDIAFASLDQIRVKKKVWEATHFIIKQHLFLKAHNELCTGVAITPSDVRVRSPGRRSPQRITPKPR